MKTLVSKTLSSILFALVLPLLALGQTDSVKAGFEIKGFIDAYYVYDFQRPDDHIRQPFLYNHNRHNEFNINLAMLHAAYEKSNVRARLGIMAGTYAQDNYAAEENLLKNVFEANVGVALNKRRSLWLDAGIFPSHIGFESAISTENPTLTRSLLAENSPYFLSGAKLSWSVSEAWTFTALITNGWQRIARPFGNQAPGVGTQLQYQPHERLTFNWSTYAGSDAHDSLDQVMLFNNLYLNLLPSDKFQLIAGFDIGAREAAYTMQGSMRVDNDDWDLWYTPIIIGRIGLSRQLFLAGRAEYYSDPTGVIIDYGAPAGFETWGFSVNLDYYIQENAMFRIEGRSFRSQQAIFPAEGAFRSSNTFIAGSLAIMFP
ncbi:porin [Cesiribacter sp. SM1]|uniref:porin n=1 Tax=Cesiribacter sp. SM1 TaxID=2861196 RepID=UPI001CD1F125|nr:porin [Cesiribacter sp. SM1]